MPNIVPIQTIVAKRMLVRLQNKLPMITEANKDFQDDLRDSERRNGGIINITKPPLLSVRSGEVMDIQGVVIPAISTSLVMKGVDVSASQLDLQISYDEVESGMIDGVLDGAAAALAAQIEVDGFNQALNVANTVGTPGTAITDPGVLATAGALITSNGGGIGNTRIGLLNSFQNASFATGVKNYFNPTQVVNKAYADGRLGSGYGFESLYDEPVASTFTSGTYTGSPLVNGALTTGNTIVTDAWGAASFLNVGDTFTLAGVFNRNPQTKLSTGNLKFFVVAALSTADGSGNMTITIGEDGIINDGSPRANVVITAANTGDNTPLTVTSGASNTTSKQSLVYDKNAFTFAMVPLAKMPSNLGVMSTVVKDKMSGISISMKEAYSIETNQRVVRFDVLYTWLTTYGQLATRILG